MTFALAGLGLMLLLLFGVVCLATTEKPTLEQTLPRLVFPLHGSPATPPAPVPPDPPRRRVPEVDLSLPRAPVLALSKFRARRLRAELPHASERPCEICRGVALVWTTNPVGGWRGLCRRCGLVFAENLSGEDWKAAA